tara:strand:- start:2111 stop:2632 length:522 start_codon:yes stop_codon:yes gene_type:complete
MTTEQGEIRIYVACLASYNNGILHGCWIDAEQGVDAIYTEIREMLKASPVPGAEEYAIHDYEGFEGVSISEYQGIESVVEIAEFIADHGELGGKLLEYLGGDIDETRSMMDERYSGCYSSVADYAEELTEETTTIPDHLRYYIDYEKMARDMEINDILAIETGLEEVHVFWQH